MNTTIDNLRRLLESVRSIGFWGRLFGWKRVKDQLIDATADLERLLANFENERGKVLTAEQSSADLTKDLNIAKDDGRKKQSEIEKFQSQTAQDAEKILSLTKELSTTSKALENEADNCLKLSNKNDLLTQKNEQLAVELKRVSESEAASVESVDKLTERKIELDLEVADLKKDVGYTKDELKKANDQVLLLQADQESRTKEHGEHMSALKQYQDRVQKDRDDEINLRQAAEVERLTNMKDTWIHHQENVKQSLKTLCSRHTIDYIDKVAFKGDPDNTVSICEEFIIFDAKSPKGEDLSNFPTYIKEQSEKAKKYANQENVKKWIFFVVPMNTLSELKTFAYHLADYQVFVVTIDALEPILLSLKKVEEYDFAEQLSPEDRENICRILGKFAHLFKRRVQIDTFFINQFMELAYKCESDLPADILEKAAAFERADRLNPPQEKRVKAIPIADLEKSLTKVRNDASNKGILLEDGKLTDGLNEVPLYTNGL